MKYLYLIIQVSFLVFFSGFCIAQDKLTSPLSLFNVSHNYKPADIIELSAPDIEELLHEDAANDGEACPKRFGQLLPVSISTLDGYWENASGSDNIWRLSFYSKGAKALAFYFSKLHLPQGGKLYAYNMEGSFIIGPFFSDDIQASGFFATSPVIGETVTLEYNGPNDFTDSLILELSDIDYVYNDDQLIKGFGDSDECEVNVNCSEGDDYQTVKQGILRIQVRVNSSTYWCSGSLINNTKFDGTPYILTADHCAYKYGSYATPSNLAQWVFTFDYESETCDNPSIEPEVKTLVGATKIASGGNHGEDGSDFYLILLNLSIPSSYNPYFIGWDRSGQVSSSGVSIHHPKGDIKKISTYIQPLVSSSWNNNGLQSHWKVIWNTTTTGHGVTEGGSSGSPVFNQQGLLIGTLTGGLSACEEGGGLGPNEPDYYGKFSYHWLQNGTHDTLQLAPWLDPNSTGAMSIGGSYLSTPEYSSSTLMPEVFPNPFRDIISIRSLQSPIQQIAFFNQLGEKIWEKKSMVVKGECISFFPGELPPGVYLIVISSDNCVYRQKIIKSFN